MSGHEVDLLGRDAGLQELRDNMGHKLKIIPIGPVKAHILQLINIEVGHGIMGKERRSAHPIRQSRAMVSIRFSSGKKESSPKAIHPDRRAPFQQLGQVIQVIAVSAMADDHPS